MKKVCVAMSGGVDSSVAAFLLKEAGYDVFGVFMKLWDDPESKSTCCSLSDSLDALRVSEKLKIPFYVLNFQDEFREYVIEYFIREYKKGNTPNPCINCNLYLKFNFLLNKAQLMGADYLATGHYARIVKEGDEYFLCKGVDGKKDQSYFLFNITRALLSKIIFPLGDYTKEQVRAVAEREGLVTARKKESQEICFIENDYREFLKKHGFREEPGDITDIKGNVIGRHKGYFNYTIGQRGGLNVAKGYPIYVIDIIPEKNIIIADREEYLFKKEFDIKDLNLLDHVREDRSYSVKIRYKHRGERAYIRIVNDKYRISFETAQRAITPGQAAVIYDGDRVVGGGWIERSL